MPQPALLYKSQRRRERKVLQALGIRLAAAFLSGHTDADLKPNIAACFPRAAYVSVAVALPDGMLVATSDLRASGPVQFTLLAAARAAVGRALRTRAAVFAHRPPCECSGLDDLDAAHAARGCNLICCVPIHAAGSEGGLPVAQAGRGSSAEYADHTPGAREGALGGDELQRDAYGAMEERVASAPAGVLAATLRRSGSGNGRAPLLGAICLGMHDDIKLNAFAKFRLECELDILAECLAPLLAAEGAAGIAAALGALAAAPVLAAGAAEAPDPAAAAAALSAAATPSELLREASCGLPPPPGAGEPGHSAPAMAVTAPASGGAEAVGTTGGASESGRATSAPAERPVAPQAVSAFESMLRGWDAPQLPHFVASAAASPAAATAEAATPPRGGGAEAESQSSGDIYQERFRRWSVAQTARAEEERAASAFLAAQRQPSADPLAQRLRSVALREDSESGSELGADAAADADSGALSLRCSGLERQSSYRPPEGMRSVDLRDASRAGSRLAITGALAGAASIALDPNPDPNPAPAPSDGEPALSFRRGLGSVPAAGKPCGDHNVNTGGGGGMRRQGSMERSSGGIGGMPFRRGLEQVFGGSGLGAMPDIAEVSDSSSEASASSQPRRSVSLETRQAPQARQASATLPGIVEELQGASSGKALGLAGQHLSAPTPPRPVLLVAQAHAATQSTPQNSSPKQWRALLPRRSASAPISPTRAGGKGAGAGPPADRLWLTFGDMRLEGRFARWQAASLARVDCWAVLVALLHLAFLGFVPPVELVRAVPLLWAWQLLVLAAPLAAMRMHYEWYLDNRWWLVRGLVAHCVMFVGTAGAPELAPPPTGALPRLIWLTKAVRCEPLILSSFASLVPFRVFVPSQLLNCALALGALPRACAVWALAGGPVPPGGPAGAAALLGMAGVLVGVGVPALAVRALERRARRIFLASM
ncbi:hypothetical protein WJX81_001584 [Elliptochloris bilobata]|uniref:Guanylate cyclase domain-containing protein n=1 Tax=Elliptochloris bilobata TaxID=381761 RepID=A0AAW1QJ04_9CHLO